MEASLPDSRRTESWLCLKLKKCYSILPEEIKHNDITIIPSVENMALIPEY
jgi:hypothetical protein